MNDSRRKINSSKAAAIAGSQSLKEKGYWLGKLSGELARSSFPFDFVKPGAGSGTMEKEKFELSGEIFFRLIEMCSGSDPQLHMILTAGLGGLLYRYNGDESIILVSPIDKQDEDGEFINKILPLKIQLNEDLSFKELVLQVKNTIDGAVENQNYPIEVLLYDDLGIILEAGYSPFDIAVTLENIQDKKYIEHLDFNMIFLFLRTDNCIKGVVDYNSLRYRKETIDRILTQFRCILYESVFDVDAILSHINILTDSEKNRLLYEFNDINKNSFIDKSVRQFVEKQAEICPDKVAVIHENSLSTYRDLNRRANQLARALICFRLKKEQTVGLLLERSPEMIESILAVWKVGGAYIPIDSQYPAQRIIEVLDDSGTPVLISRPECFNHELKESYKGEIIILDDDGERNGNRNVENPDSEIILHNLAYVIYTSGSTGKPKGAMIEHLGMMNHIQAKIDDFQLAGCSIVAQNASHTFDISVWQFFAGLVVGGKTVIYSNRLVLDPEQFITKLTMERVTILEVVPSYLSLILDFLDATHREFESLNYLLVTGETVKPKLVKRWFEKYPAKKMANAYGPTEASDDITHYIMDKAPDTERISIGKPLQNLNIYIVDEHMNLCPIGIKGEICVSGIGVGRGYLNDDTNTKKVFGEDPFITGRKVRFYKTGDFGRWFEDGTIDFLGRKDHQVKIRGFRIETEEIEARLSGYPGIKEALVMDREDEKGNAYLCAYIVRQVSRSVADGDEKGQKTGHNDISAKLRLYLSRHLPDYMVPAYFVELDQLPLTENGKVNGKALPEPEPVNRTPMTYISEKMLGELKKSIKKNLGEISEEQYENFFRNIVSSVEKEKMAMEEVTRAKGRKYYPLSHSQKMIYYNEKRYSGTSCENLIYLMKYSGNIEAELLERAINIVLIKNDSLRIRVVEIEHNGAIVPGQYVSDYQAYSLEYFDFSGNKGEKNLEDWIDRSNKKPFLLIDNDLFYFAYIKFSEMGSGYYMKFHHIISDGWTTSLVTNEIDRIYKSLVTGKDIDAKPNPSYFHYVDDERGYLETAELKDDMRFWHRELIPLPEEINLSVKAGNPSDIEGNALTLTIPGSLRAKIHDYRRIHKTSVYKLLLSALSIYISRVTGSDDFVIGTLNHNRTPDSHRETAGTFIRFIPIRIKVDRKEAFRSFVEEVGGKINTILKNHQKYPFDFLINEIRERTGIDPVYFYNVNLIGHPDVSDVDFEIEHHFPVYEPTPLSIHINFANKDILGTLELEWDYQVQQFSARDVEGIHRALIEILGDALDNPGKRLSEISLTTGSDMKQVFSERQFFIGGVRIEPKKIESKLLEYNGIKEAVVVRKSQSGNRAIYSGGNSFGAFITADRTLSNTDVRDYLSRELPDYLIPSYYVQLEKMPLNTNAEIERKMLAGIDIEIGSEYAGPRNDVEAKLLEIWQDELGRGWTTRKKGRIGIKDNFFNIGGDSIKSISMLSRINKEFGIKLKVLDLYRNPTLEKLARQVTEAKRNDLAAGSNEILEEFNEMKKVYIEGMSTAGSKITEDNIADVYPMTDIQRGIIYHSLRDSLGIVFFNQRYFLFKDREFNTEVLDKSTALLVEKHQILRTGFDISGGKEPLQVVFNKIHPDIAHYDISGLEKARQEEYINTVIREDRKKPFNISTRPEPLWRIRTFVLDSENVCFVWQNQHAILDGWSFASFITELSNTYFELKSNPNFVPDKLKSSYRELVVEERLEKRKGEILDFWKKELAGFKKLDFSSKTGSDMGNYEIKTHTVDLGEEFLMRLNNTAKKYDSSVMNLCFAAYVYILSILSYRKDIVVGLSSNNRPVCEDGDKILGCFINHLPLRVKIPEEMNWSDFIRMVDRKILQVRKYERMSFFEIVQAVGGKAKDQNPLFDTIFNFMDFFVYDKIEHIEITENGNGAQSSIFSLETPTAVNTIFTFHVSVYREFLYTIEYYSPPFDDNVIRLLANCFKNVLHNFMYEPESTIDEKNIVSDEEEQTLLSDFLKAKAFTEKINFNF